MIINRNGALKSISWFMGKYSIVAFLVAFVLATYGHPYIALFIAVIPMGFKIERYEASSPCGPRDEAFRILASSVRARLEKVSKKSQQLPNETLEIVQAATKNFNDILCAVIRKEGL